MFKPHEIEYISDVFQWASECNIQTIELRMYHKIDPKTVGNGKRHKKIVMFKCTYMELEGNRWISVTHEAETIEKLRHKMGDKMHEKWQEPVGDLLESEEDNDCF